MRGVLLWLNLYGCQAVWCKLKKGLKMHFIVFLPLFPDNHINALCINLSYSLKFSRKNIEWWSWKRTFFGHWVFQKNVFCFCFFPIQITLAFIWIKDGFFRILEKTSSEDTTVHFLPSWLVWGRNQMLLCPNGP